MRCLVVGGTGFLGGAIAAALAEAGHDTTVLSRRRDPQGLPAGMRAIRGDRDADLSALSGAAFDWVFDTCAYAPDMVERLLDALPAPPARYVLVSSISTYGTFATPRREDEAVAAATDADLALAAAVPAGERASAFAYGASYGPLKRACEIAALDRLGDRATILRVGLLVGVGDYTNRLTWWVRRLDRAAVEGGPVPAPTAGVAQMIDVRDVANFALRLAAEGRNGTWNVTGPATPLADVLHAVADTVGHRHGFHWLAPDAITAAGVEPWTDMPLMSPPDPDFRCFMDVDTTKAMAGGLALRPLERTLEALLSWDRARRNVPLSCGLSPEQERQLLAIDPAPGTKKGGPAMDPPRITREP
ncbi:NAD-dependent epimerase/dehydratase family protein [Jannaschia sp. LMIT008]|uniref:NAD-dependent epimerase/dehydratase family protein n=1 Tax=Jannaschia maritima TaxID=3032585 RepID=UPI0028125FE7|nr:NAD-dependent epimerase/dehydratase family protein [Jannaschia sp. LMIT008]